MQPVAPSKGAGGAPGGRGTTGLSGALVSVYAVTTLKLAEAAELAWAVAPTEYADAMTDTIPVLSGPLAAPVSAPASGTVVAPVSAPASNKGLQTHMLLGPQVGAAAGQATKGQRASLRHWASCPGWEVFGKPQRRPGPQESAEGSHAAQIGLLPRGEHRQSPDWQPKLLGHVSSTVQLRAHTPLKQ